MLPAVPTTYASRPSSTSAARPRGVRTMLAKVFAVPFRAWRNRRSAASLLHLDPYLLADIGLTRGDVSQALRTEILDPSDTLRQIADERRGLARAAAQARLAEQLGVRLT